MLKVYSPEAVDQVFPKVRAFSTGEGESRWDLIKDVYTAMSIMVDYDGTPRVGQDGIRDFTAEWAARERFTNGWQEHVLMIAEDVCIKFYRFCNRGSDDTGEPWDFMTEGFWVGRKNEDGSWQVLIDVPWCGTNELVGTVVPTSPWQALLEPLDGDRRRTEESIEAVEVS